MDARDETKAEAIAPFDGGGAGKPRLRLHVPVGRSSASLVRPVLAELVADADPVVIEQIAVLVGALTSGDDQAPASRPFEVEVWAEPEVVAVMLRDPDFGRHRTEADFVQLDRSMVSGWRLRLVERLADRWSVANDDGLVMWFEFDIRRGDATLGERTVTHLPVRGSAPPDPPIGRSGFIRRNGRSGDGQGADAGRGFCGVD